MKLLRAITLFVAICIVVPAQTSPVNMRLVTDEADAVLAILAKRKANESIDNRH